jgi:hypothetical protein
VHVLSDKKGGEGEYVSETFEGDVPEMFFIFHMFPRINFACVSGEFLNFCGVFVVEALSFGN